MAVFTDTYFFILLLLVIFFILTLILLLNSFSHFIVLLVFLDLLILINVIIIIIIGLFSNNDICYAYALIALAVGACDTAVGLGLCLLYFKATFTISISN